MVITKDVFAATFQLWTEGMVGFTDIPTTIVAEMKKVFVGTDVSFRPPNKKKNMKVEYRLLHDIVAKALCAKDGSFDVMMSEKFEMMVAISTGLKLVHTSSRQSQGFAVPFSILLDKVVQADLGESVKLHLLKVLNDRSVLIYMKKNQAVPQAGQRNSAFARPNPVEEHCLLVLKSAWEEVSSKMTEYVEWALFRTDVRLNTIMSMTPIASMAKIEDEFMPLAEIDLVSELLERMLLGRIVSNKGTTTLDQETEQQPTKEAEQRILSIEHQAHEEEQPDPEYEETVRIEQQAQEKIEEISRVFENVEENEAEAEAVNSQEHEAQEEEHQAQD
ncbi:hypothetical protein F511_15139 [Dorcoceras hygrometricum]|uniref:Uncharacterized protein n=1 Tax=Dorcoceras hygrometricum TaxID=472368 RepID=A0A2Z7B526_9LAMI|nr:hypothetical protein F511_15139 [Dorcoceras hygrometricum]